jgi:hypothetical protein
MSVCHGNRLTIEVMLEEIGKRPGAADAAAAANGGTREGGSAPEEREGYALAAGLAIGLITLGKGRSATGLSDLRIEDRLRCAFTELNRILFPWLPSVPSKSVWAGLVMGLMMLRKRHGATGLSGQRI